MKIHFFVWACLAFFCQTAASANSNPTESDRIEFNKDSKASSSATKEIVELIPGRELSVKVNVEKNILNVNLTGTSENLEWIIFQPKGKLISRISTTSKFDEIKIDNLTAGKYVLLIKDTSGRMLFRSFEK